jgi:pyruvate formate lyase activating enzyme
LAEIRNIKGFLETSLLDWEGRLCSVVFLGGCNFRCPFCHNALLAAQPQAVEDLQWDSIKRALWGLLGWIDGVCFTGGEPTIHPHLEEMLREVRSMGLKVKLDTNGSLPHILQHLLDEGLLDAVSMDIKAPLKHEIYGRCCGVKVRMEDIGRSIELLAASDIQVEFRTTFVPGLLDEEDLLEIALSIPKGVPYRIQAFRAKGTLDPSFESIPSVSHGDLLRIQRMIASFVPSGSASYSMDRSPAQRKDQTWEGPLSPPQNI